MDQQVENYKTGRGVILAVAGSVAGLGHLWRFPIMIYRNGGGSFVVAYLVSIFTIGLFLMMAEIGMGHRFRVSLPLLLSRINRKFEILGWWMVSYLFFGVALYYSIVASWFIWYFLHSLTSTWHVSNVGIFSKKIFDISRGPYDFGLSNNQLVYILGLMWLLNFLLSSVVKKRVLELLNKILVVLLFALITFLVVYVFLDGGGMKGIAGYLRPDFAKMKEISVWGSAVSQALFSLSIGFGLLISFGSHLPSKSRIRESVFWSTVGNGVFAMVSGFIVFIGLNYISNHGIHLKGNAYIGPEVPFLAYHAVLANLGSIGRIIAPLFFFLVGMCGIMSGLSIMDTVTSSMMDKLGWRRSGICAASSLIAFVCSIIFTFKSGIFWVDILDHFIVGFALLLGTSLELMLIVFVIRPKVIIEHIDVSDFHAPYFYKKVFEWVTKLAPLFMVVILLMVILEIILSVMKPYKNYTWDVIVPFGFGWILLTILIAYILSSLHQRVTKGVSIKI